MSALELDDIQGNVLCGYNFPLATYLHFHFPPGPSVRPLMLDLADKVTSSKVAPKGDVVVNVAVSYQGLVRLEVDPKDLATFPEEYRDGMARRSAAGFLGDAGDNAPDHWERYSIEELGHLGDGVRVDGGGTPEGTDTGPVPVHVLVIVHARAPGPLARRINDVMGYAGPAGGVCVRQEKAQVLAGGDRRDSYEHFGFKDGVSQPVLNGAPGTRTAKDGGFYDPDRREWRKLEVGEFVLGYPDEEEPHPRLPRPWQLVRNGSYLVYRKISQDVAAFNQFVNDLTAKYSPLGVPVLGMNRLAETLKAKFVGRLPDGSPLVAPDSRPRAGRSSNDFRYGTDPKGYWCPYGSHIRRANPRDELNFGLQLVQRHRLIRRGMPFGRPFNEAPGEPRGLIFIAYCASIARQYEFVQSQWINNGESLGLGPDSDPILGTGLPATRFVLQGQPPRFLRLSDPHAPISPLVTVQWGEYFFQPGIQALKWLGAAAR